jgi:hypothetical protein
MVRRLLDGEEVNSLRRFSSCETFRDRVIGFRDYSRAVAGSV